MNLNPFYWLDLFAQRQGFEEGKKLGLVEPNAVFKPMPPTTIRELREERNNIFP